MGRYIVAWLKLELAQGIQNGYYSVLYPLSWRDPAQLRTGRGWQLFSFRPSVVRPKTISSPSPSSPHVRSRTPHTLPVPVPVPVLTEVVPTVGSAQVSTTT